MSGDAHRKTVRREEVEVVDVDEVEESTQQLSDVSSPVPGDKRKHEQIKAMSKASCCLVVI